MSPPSASSRTYWPDALKCLAILLVVIGHTRTLNPALTTYIFSFHVPLFFFISGYLVKKSRLQAPYPAFLNRHFKSLIVPYLCFGFVTYLLWLVLNIFIYPPQEIDWVKPLIGMVYGVNGKEDWLVHDVPLWFFPALFMTHAIFYWLVKPERTGLLILFLFISAFLGYYCLRHLPFYLPWGTEVALMATVFYAAGYLLQGRKISLGKPSLLFSVMLFLIFTAIQLFLIKLNGRIDMNIGRVGNPFLFYPTAFLGILSWILIAKQLPEIPLLSTTGRSTVVIFSLHMSVFTLISVFISWLKPPIIPVHAIAFTAAFYTLLYMLTTIVLLLPVATLIRKYVPWMAGERSTKKDNRTAISWAEL